MNLLFENNKIVLYPNSDISFDSEDIISIKKYFKNLFIKLRTDYELNINGLYLVTIYKDINNTVIEIEKEENDFCDYMVDEIDMHILIEENPILYELEDIFIDLKHIKKYKLFKCKNKIYLELQEQISNINKGYLNEISTLIYKNTKNIIKYGEEISLKKSFI